MSEKATEKLIDREVLLDLIGAYLEVNEEVAPREIAECALDAMIGLGLVDTARITKSLAVEESA